MKKKIIGTLLILTPLMLSSCNENNTNSLASTNPNSTSEETLDDNEIKANYTKNNEILTYKPFDDSKEQLVVANTGKVTTDTIDNLFLSTHSNTQIINFDIAGGVNQSLRAPFFDWLDNCVVKPDIIYINLANYTKIISSGYFEDLTNYDFLSNYYASNLQDIDIDGKIYALPGASTLKALCYNKTLFDKYGWSVPTNIDEFIALCKQITTDTNGEIDPFNPNAKYGEVFLGFLESLCYKEFMGNYESAKWLKDFRAGRASFDSHFNPMLNVFKRLVDNGIVVPSDFTYSATTRYNEFNSGKIAMLNHGLTQAYTTTDDIRYVPFPGATSDESYLEKTYSYLIAVVKSPKRSEHKKQLIKDYLSLISSKEGQAAYIGSGLMFPAVKSDNPLSNEPKYAGIKDAIANEKMFTSFLFDVNGLGMHKDIESSLKEYIDGSTTETNMLASLNSLYDEYKISGKKDPGEVIASATSNFTTLELSSFFADNFKEACNSDIGLMLHGITARGNLMHLFKGDIYSETIQNFLPRSLDSKAYLSKASVSGATLLEILKHPSNNNAGTCDGVYAVSGLKVSYAPWASTRFISATLSDGTPLENDKTYTIAYWDGTVDKSYLSDAQNTTYNSFVPFITERLKTLKTVTPYNDNRYNLDWNKLD